MEKVDIQPTNEGLATTLLPIDLRVAVSKTLRYYGLLSGTILNYVLKKESAQRLGKVALAVCWIIVARQFTLLFSRFDDVQLWLGFPMGIDKKAYVTVGILVWSIYAGLVMRLFYEGQHLDVRGLNWLQPLQVVEGTKPPSTFGLDGNDAIELAERAKGQFHSFWIASLIRTFLLGFVFFGDMSMSYKGNLWESPQALAWIAVLCVWSYFTSGVIYMSLGCFDLVCFYFEIAFGKVNGMVDAAIEGKFTRNEDRVALVSRILNNHNQLCVKITDYNRFWSSYLFYSYMMFVGIFCFTLYQAIFSYRSLPIKLCMFALAMETAFLFTKMILSGSALTDEAHASYTKLIRASFEEYPVELRIQLRLLIQRLAGKSVGFYCSDLFEVSHATFFAIVLALGQNFLLIVDFAVDYIVYKQNYTAPIVPTNLTTANGSVIYL